MKYYKAVETEEHLLYAKEIAKLMGINSKYSGLPHSKMIKNVLEKIRIKKNEDSIFYSAKSGMGQVYPSEWALDAARYINKRTTYVKDIECYHFKSGVNNFYFNLKEENTNA